MFTIVTGAPGASKTLNTIKRFKDVKDRPVYYRGIKGLTLDWIELDDSQAKEFDKHCPDGSIVIIDEAQQIFPLAPNGARVPEALQFLETHRHRGFDIVFISQHPMLLHAHARKICNEHYHYSRSFGTNTPYEYHSGSGFVNTSDQKELDRTTSRKKVKIDSNIFDLYKSAEVHTHKKSLPKKVYILYSLIALIFVVLIFGFNWFSGVLSGETDGLGTVSDSSNTVATSDSRTLIPNTFSQDQPLDWSELLTPQIDGLPFTAPLYEKEASQPKQIPRIAACMNSRSQGCNCYTQQATKISGISQSFCEKFVQDGMFDHLIEPLEVGQREETARTRAEPPSRPHHIPVPPTGQPIDTRQPLVAGSQSGTDPFWRTK